MEAQSIAAGDSRVKFRVRWVSTISDLLSKHPPGLQDKMLALTESMNQAVQEMEYMGVTPVMMDGKVGGNVAATFHVDDNNQYLVVTKSGKMAGHTLTMDDICVVTSFNREAWSVDYAASSHRVLPTSDTPLHYYALTADEKFGWEVKPIVSFHGHALETEEEAARVGLPISKKETLFSTPEDSEALVELMQAYPFPEHKTFIRKGHGFVLLGTDWEDAFGVLREKVQPYITKP